MPFDVTKHWYRQRIFDPTLCDQSTYRIKTVKQGVQIGICKLATCTKRGDPNCSTIMQSMRFSKRYYKLDSTGSIIKK